MAEVTDLTPYLETLSGITRTFNWTIADGSRVRHPEEIREAVLYLVEWFSAVSTLRGTIRTMQLGGLFYTSHLEFRVTSAYLNCADGGADAAVRDAVSRLCQDSSADGA